MLLLLCALGFAEEIVGCEEPVHKDIMVAIPNIYDPVLKDQLPSMTKALFMQTYIDSNRVLNLEGVDSVSIHDMYSIKFSQDTVCDYNDPVKCGVENMHWVLVTDVYTSSNSAMINMKLYNEDAEIIGSAAMPSSSVVSCQNLKKPSKHPRPEAREEARGAFAGRNPKQCIFLDPHILSQDIKTATSMLFSSISPL